MRRILLLATLVLAWAWPASAQQTVSVVSNSLAVASEATLSSIKTAVEGTVDVNVAFVNDVTPLAAVVNGTLQSAATANGNGAPMSVNGYPKVAFTVNCSVACSGGTTVNLEGSEDGTNYEALAGVSRLGALGTFGSAILNQGTTPTVWVAEVGGLQAVRARISAYSAGTVTVTGRTVTAGGTAVQTSTPVAAAAGGGTTLSFISAGATEDEHAVCTGPCNLYSILVTNVNAAVRYLKCENDTAAGTAPGTDTPEFRIAVPGATTGAGASHSFPVGAYFSTALTCWLVTGAADSDVAEVAANELMVFYTYKQ